MGPESKRQLFSKQKLKMEVSEQKVNAKIMYCIFSFRKLNFFMHKL